MENFQNSALCGAVQVDEQVATGNEIEMRERWIFNYVVNSEKNRFAQLATNAISIRFSSKKSTQSLGRDICQFSVPVVALARYLDCFSVQVRSKDLQGCRTPA